MSRRSPYGTRPGQYRPTPRRTYNLNMPLFKLTNGSGAQFAAGVLLLLPLMVFLGVGLIMVMFGIVHSYYPPVPAFGWWETLGVYVLVQMLTAKSNSN